MATHSSVLPGESQGRGSLMGCRLWGRTESDTNEATQQQQQHHEFSSSLPRTCEALQPHPMKSGRFSVVLPWQVQAGSCLYRNQNLPICFVHHLKQ